MVFLILFFGAWLAFMLWAADANFVSAVVTVSLIALFWLWMTQYGCLARHALWCE